MVAENGWQRSINLAFLIMICFCLQKMDQSIDSTKDSNISKDTNQARRECDRARRNNLTPDKKEEINARRRAARQKKTQGKKLTGKIYPRKKGRKRVHGDAHLGKANLKRRRQNCELSAMQKLRLRGTPCALNP